MSNISGGGNVPGSAPDYLVSSAGQATAGDSGVSLHALQQTLSKLKSSELDTIDKMLHEYQEQIGKETREDAKLGTEHVPGTAMGNLPTLPGGSPFTNIGEVERLVIQAAVQGSNEDLKHIMGAVHDMQQRRTRRRWLILGAGLLGLLALGGFLLWQNPGPPDVSPGPPDSNPGPPNSNPGPPDNPSSGQSIPPAGVCSIHFSNPTSAEAIPLAGQFPVAWSEVPGAVAYDLKMVPPASFSVPWLFHVKGTSKNIYMENFPAAGDYELSVSALGPNGETLCSNSLKFRKSAYSDSSGNNKEPAGGCTSRGMYVICP